MIDSRKIERTVWCRRFGRQVDYKFTCAHRLSRCSYYHGHTRTEVLCGWPRNPKSKAKVPKEPEKDVKSVIDDVLSRKEIGDRKSWIEMK